MRLAASEMIKAEKRKQTGMDTAATIAVLAALTVMTTCFAGWYQMAKYSEVNDSPGKYANETEVERATTDRMVDQVMGMFTKEIRK